jgi:hypothetical protein
MVQVPPGALGSRMPARRRRSRTWLAVVLLVLAVVVVVGGFSALAWISGEAFGSFVDRIVTGTAG